MNYVAEFRMQLRLAQCIFFYTTILSSAIELDYITERRTIDATVTSEPHRPRGWGLVFNRCSGREVRPGV